MQQERATPHELNSYWLNKDDMLVVSDFQWTGSHFRPAPPQTQRWWNRMRGWVERTAIKNCLVALASGLFYQHCRSSKMGCDTTRAILIWTTLSETQRYLDLRMSALRPRVFVLSHGLTYWLTSNYGFHVQSGRKNSGYQSVYRN